MLRLSLLVATCTVAVFCHPFPATTIPPAVLPAVPAIAPVAALPYVAAAPGIPAIPGVPGVPGYNGYRSPYYNPASATAPIISYSNNRGIDGSYSYSYATGDGKQAQESGFLKDAYIDNTGSPQGTQVVEGSYAYTSPEGTPIQVSYVADENGFRPSGVHIPADGKAVVPPVVGTGINGVYDPRFNRYNPGTYRNPYNPYNPIKPYDPRYNLYNPYSPAINHVKKIA